MVPSVLTNSEHLHFSERGLQREDKNANHTWPGPLIVWSRPGMSYTRNYHLIKVKPTKCNVHTVMHDHSSTSRKFLNKDASRHRDPFASEHVWMNADARMQMQTHARRHGHKPTQRANVNTRGHMQMNADARRCK